MFNMASEVYFVKCNPHVVTIVIQFLYDDREQETVNKNICQLRDVSLTSEYDNIFILQIIHDLENLVAEISGNYVHQVIALLKSCSIEVIDLVKQGILHGAQSLRDILPILMNSVVDSLVEKSVEVR